MRHSNDSKDSRRVHDITLPFRNGLPGWPGDTPFTFRLNWTQATGASVNVGSFETSLHTGTHADSPFHFDANGQTIDALDVRTFVGPAVVLDVSGEQFIDVARLEAAAHDLGRGLNDLLRSSPRLLLKTMSWTDRERFPEKIATLHESAAHYLAQSGAILLGVDVPSVDELDSKTLAVHHALHRGNVMILENLLLDTVPAGTYDLCALPLKIEGADGAPVRAVLLETNS